jgi:AcrR family transcriptional regulator
MSTSYLLTGRTRQKTRTRAALVVAARELLASGTTPTVEQAADRARIARATAYRYFPRQGELIVATYPEIAEGSLLDGAKLTDPIKRLDAVAKALTRQIVEHEVELRSMLRLSLESDTAKRGDLPFRKGRRIIWVADALSPLRRQFRARKFDRLVQAIAAGLGIEALVWLTDIAGLSRRQATTLMRWSAKALLQSALRDAQ